MSSTSSPLPPHGPVHLPVAVAERYLSVARLSTYRRATGGDDPRALDLYEWNTRAAGALWPVLGDVEVAVRNAIDTQLQARHIQRGRSGHWLSDPVRELDERARTDIDKATARLSRTSPAPPPGKVIAELSFGFWRYLLARRYTATLWPAVRPAFAHMPGRDRRLLEQPMSDLHLLRNRAAHQEPLFAQPLAERYEQALTVLGYLDPSLRAWAEARSHLPHVLGDLPAGLIGPTPRHRRLR